MKRLKRISALLLAAIMTMAVSLPVLAKSSDDFRDTKFGGKIVIHKYDTSAYENYEGNEGDGTVLGDGAIVGKNGNKEVKIGDKDLKVLPNTPFHVESVEIMTQRDLDSQTGGGTTVEPSNPDHYKKTETITAATYTTDSKGLITLTGLPQGIYRITEEKNSTSIGEVDPFLVSLPMTDPKDKTGNDLMKEVHVYPKNETYKAPGVDKVADTITINDNANPGKIISWKITAEIPSTISGAEGKESYVLTDTYGEHLTYLERSVKVYYKNGENEVVLTEGASNDYTIDISMKNTVKITLTQSGRKALADAISATPSATISGAGDYTYALYFEYKTSIEISDIEWAVLIKDENKAGITNQVGLRFINDSNTEYNSNSKDTPMLYQLKIHKYDGANKSTSLAGAKFKLYKKLTNTGTVDPDTVLKDGDEKKEVEVTTDDNGIAYINALPKGTYYLLETKAPNGYNLNRTPIEVVIDPDKSDDTLVDYGTVTSEVPNYNNFTLPTTGGMGTMLFTIGGIILLAAAGVVFFISRRKKAE